MPQRFQMFINNEWTDSLDPYSGEAWTQVPKANALDVGRRPMLSRRALISVALLHTAIGAKAQGSSFPNRAVRLIIPSPPGQSTDIVARIIGAELGKLWPAGFIIDNKGGGASIPAMIAGRDAPPDGYTLLLGTVGAMALNPVVFPNLAYDPIKDYQYVSPVYSVPSIIVARSNSTARDLPDMLREAKARDGKMPWGVPGVTSIQRLAGEDLKKRAGIGMEDIVYKGSAPMIVDLLGGQVEFAIDSLSSALPHVTSGRLKALAVCSAERLPSLPLVPTAAEAGFPGFQSVGWAGLLAPAKTPRTIVEKINSDVGKVLAMPAVQAKFIEVGAIVDLRTTPEWKMFVEQEIEKVRTIVRTSGIKLE